MPDVEDPETNVQYMSLLDTISYTFGAVLQGLHLQDGRTRASSGPNFW